MHVSVCERHPTADRYLAGQSGSGGAVWVSGRNERGWSISGVELLLENRDNSTRESDFTVPETQSVAGARRGRRGVGSHTSQRCSVTPLEGSAATCSFSATVRSNSPSTRVSTDGEKEAGWC